MVLRELWPLLRDTTNAWIDDRASSMGAALAFYALFSVAPLLIIAIAIAGIFFGEEAARGVVWRRSADSSATQAPCRYNPSLKAPVTPPRALWQ